MCRESDDELNGSDAADEVDLIEDSNSDVEVLDEETAPKRKRKAVGTLPVSFPCCAAPSCTFCCAHGSSMQEP